MAAIGLYDLAYPIPTSLSNILWRLCTWCCKGPATDYSRPGVYYKFYRKYR